MRESYRNFFTGTVEPLGSLIAAELSEKLGQEIEFFFPEIVKSDISARSRAYASFRQTQKMDRPRGPAHRGAAQGGIRRLLIPTP